MSTTMRLIPLLLAAAACASGTQTRAEPLPERSATGVAWPVSTREHVDLWLHAFALLQRDTARVPFFDPGYRDNVTRLKTSAGLTSQLDANIEQLRARFSVNRNLESAQFIALYFGSWESLVEGARVFFQVDGDPRRVSNPSAQQIVAFLAAYFPLAADREWLRLFMNSLADERGVFYRQYWLQQQRDRAAALTAIDSLWQQVYYARLRRVLDNTRQGTGDFLLSLPLDGEGRTITSATGGAGSRLNIVATSFPATPDRAIEAIYVFVHEASGAVTSLAVSDHTTPAEKREGLEARYQTHALVRGGAMLMQKVAPELADGYARYYLRVARVPVPAGNPAAALAAAFPLPEAIVEGIRRQIEIVLGGI